MKKMAIFTALAVASAMSAASADNSYVTYARVVESKPIVETVYEITEVCRYKYVSERRRGAGGGSNTGEKLIGGLLGGAAGSAVGKGTGRDAAAGVGALVGAEISAQDGGITEGELIGGLVGGVVGNQVGGGSGKTAATAAGVLLGSIVGDNLQNGGAVIEEDAGKTAKRKVRMCEDEETPKKIITGYDVTFEHDGHQFAQHLSREPGDYVEIHVNVEALEQRLSSR